MEKKESHLPPFDDDDKLKQIYWLVDNNYIPEHLESNAVRYYEEEKNVEKFTKIFEDWNYDAYLQKSSKPDENYFKDITINETNKIIAVFGSLYSGREYVIKHLYNAGRKAERKFSYVKKGVNGLLFKELKEFSSEKDKVGKSIGMMIRCFPLNEFYSESTIEKFMKERFINQFIANIADVIIFINNDEDDKNYTNLNNFIKLYNIKSWENTIFITNKFKGKDNLNKQKADTNIFTIYYENEDYNIKIFKLIFDKIKKHPKQKQAINLSKLYLEYYKNNQKFLIEDFLKCEYKELLNSDIKYRLLAENNNIKVILECFEKIDNVSYKCLVWNNSLYLILSVESTSKTLTIYEIFENKSEEITRITYQQSPVSGILEIILLFC